MTLLYIVNIPKRDEEGDFKEAHYFKNLYRATIFGMKHDVENFTSMEFNEKLAEKLIED